MWPSESWALVIGGEVWFGLAHECCVLPLQEQVLFYSTNHNFHNSLAHSRGPHHFVTAQPGLGNLRSMLATVRSDSPIASMVSDLDHSQVGWVGWC